MPTRRRSPLSKPSEITKWPHADSDLQLNERVYRRLRWLILTHTWRRGVKLPASRTLASQMGVSRNTVLNALDRLLSDDWVSARQGSGVYVTYAGPPVSPDLQ